MKKMAVVMILVLSASFAALAAIVQPPDGVNGYYSNTPFPQGIADDFVSPISGQVTAIEWFGGYVDNLPSTNLFTIKIFTEIGGLPGVKISEESAPIVPIGTSVVFSGFVDEYYYSMALASPVPVTSGTNYWLCIYSDDAEWAWESGGMGNSIAAWSTNAGSGFEAGWMFDSPHDLASLITVVPEPGSVALFVLGAAAIAIRRRSTKK
ncbi:MAG TPA: PEP-CTERM sorting domain-containing protein [Candidatus Brocadiia bacterium]|nr:PEP-CTERM sorting domain-containing protein [Candidatus Brocadiia bacterium]